jgi:hypothetical protein
MVGELELRLGVGQLIELLLLLLLLVIMGVVGWLVGCWVDTAGWKDLYRTTGNALCRCLI